MNRFFQRLGARALTSALQALSMLLVARQQQPSAFGHLVLGLSIGVIVGAVAGVGSTTRALRILREKDPGGMAASLTLTRICSTSMVVVFVALSGMFLETPVFEGAAIAVIAGVDHFCEFESALRAGQLRHTSSVFVLCVQRGLPMAAVGIAYLLSWNSILAYGIASAVVVCVIAPDIARRRAPLVPLRRVIRTSWGYWGGALAQALQQVDVSIVRAVTGPVGVGLYGAGNRLTGPLGLFVNSAVIVFSPGLGQIREPDVRYRSFARFARLAALFGLGVALASPLVGYAVVTCLGSAYKPAEPIIVGVTVAAGLGSVVQVLQSYLYVEGRAHDSAMASLVGVTIGLVVLAYVGWSFGTSWLWCGIFANYTAMLVVLLWKFHRHRPQTTVS